LLLWIKGSRSPAEIRESLLSEDSDFRERLVLWLESCHRGEFSSGTMSTVAARDTSIEDEFELVPGDPTAGLPSRPPRLCSDSNLAKWFKKIEVETDEIVFRSNRHSPLHNGGCRKNERVDCRARFPRSLQENTAVDSESGGLLLKKRERWINTYSVPLSYLLRCNSDVTCLLSGTMVRAVIAYVTDYVTKSSLKTHTM
ncbi:hypothetical protein BC629DRAFT_1246715, partial [Irpex lacteus]